MPQLRNIFRVGVIFIFTAIFVGFFFLNFNFVEAIIGPSQGPGDGGGSLSVDANRNLGFNTSVVGTTTAATPPFGNFSKVFMIAATSSPPGLGLRSVASGCPPEGCSGQSLYPSTWVWRLTPWGFMELVNATDEYYYNQGPAITFGGGSAYSRRVIVGNFYSSTSSMSEAFNVVGNMQATQSVIAKGSFSGTTLAGNVASGLFGSLQGGGNFAFGNTLTVGTSTPSNTPANGLYVYGNVGIGTATPDYKLKVVGSSVAMGTNAGDFTLNIQQGGAGGELFLQLDGSTKMTVDNNGNVGIGNTLSSSIDTNAGVVRTVIGSATGATQGVLDLVTNTAGVSSGIGLLQFGNYNISGTEKRIAIIEGQTNGAVNSGKLNFYTASAGSLGIKAVIDANGNMGIGTTNPAYKLDVGGAVNATAFYQNGSLFVGGGGGGGSAEGWSRTSSTGAVYLTTSTDNVGIGTATPGYKLQVNGTSSTPVASFYAGKERLSLKHDATADTFQLYHYDDTALAEQKIALGLGNYLVVDPAGNVGIGSTSPVYKLDLGTSNTMRAHSYFLTTGSIQSNGSSVRLQSGSDFTFDTPSSGTVVVTIKSGGNVGISTTTPSYKLDVVGTAQFSQPVIVGTPTANSHAATKNYVDSVLTGGASEGSFNTLAVAGTSTLATAAGGVGVGTTAPITKLQINKSGQLLGQTTPNGAFVISNLSSGNGGLELGVDNTSLAYIQSRNITSNTNYNLLLNPNGGNIGIGTTSAAQKLQIAGSTLISNNNYYYGYTSGGAIAVVAGITSGDAVQLGQNNVNHSSTNIYGGTGNVTIGAGSATVATFATTGNVGIGTTSPGMTLDVTGNIRATNGIYNMGASTFIQSDKFTSYYANDLVLQGRTGLGIAFNYNGGTTGIYLNNAGNVGIATTTPSYKLDVVGTSQFSQPVIVGTPTANTHAATKNYVDSMFTGSGQWTTNGGLVYLTSTTQNVGIGTTNPTGKLEVAGMGTTDDDVVFKFSMGSNDTSHSATDFRVGSPASSWGGIRFSNPSSNVTNLEFSNWNGSARTVRMGIYGTSGNVGIGTTGSGAKLEVATLTGTTGILVTGVDTNGFADLDIKSVGTTGSSRLFFSDTAAQSGFIKYDHSANSMLFGTTGANAVTINTSGNVGIATTTPQYTLSVSGTGAFNQPIFVGTPTNASHSATKSYVDSIVGGGAGAGSFTTLAVSGTSTLSGNIWFGGAVYSNLNMNGKDIVGVNKITAVMIDPLYRIDNTNYSTFGISTAGAVYEEYIGRGRLTPSIKYKVSSIKYTENSKYGEEDTKYSIPNTEYSYTIDFSKVPRGSDLWLWYNVVDFGNETVNAIATSLNVPANIYYEIQGRKIIFHADILNTKYSIPTTGLEFSFRLSGKRHDWKEWPMRAKDQGEEPSFILNSK